MATPTRPPDPRETPARDRELPPDEPKRRTTRPPDPHEAPAREALDLDAAGAVEAADYSPDRKVERGTAPPAAPGLDEDAV